MEKMEFERNFLVKRKQFWNTLLRWEGLKMAQL